MVKKCIIAIAVVALLATTVQAANPIKKDPGQWPWTYTAIEICTIPVYIEVGFFVQLEDCGDHKIELKQVNCEEIGKEAGDFPCYYDCTDDIKVRANFKAIFGAELTKTSPILEGDTGTELSWTKGTPYPDSGNQIQGIGDWEKLQLCMAAWKVEMWRGGAPDGDVQVGTITINVKPPDGP